MKPIDELTNVDKAQLMHQLFPAEIPALIEFITGMSATIKEHEEDNRKAWDNGFMTFDYWLGLIDVVEANIQRYGVKLYTNKTLFAERLFDGMLALYTNHCFRVYLTTKQHPDKRFAAAFDLFFN